MYCSVLQVSSQFSTVLQKYQQCNIECFTRTVVLLIKSYCDNNIQQFIACEQTTNFGEEVPLYSL